MVNDGERKLSFCEIFAKGLVAKHFCGFKVQNVVHDLVVQPEVVAQRNEIAAVIAEALKDDK